MTDYISRKLMWLEAVARDRKLSRGAVVVAVLLACRYFNAESGEAWPSGRTLARDLGMTLANVQIGVARLIEAGFLRKRSGGPRTTNRYSIPRRWRAPERHCQQCISDIASNVASDIASNVRTHDGTREGTRDRGGGRKSLDDGLREGTKKRAQSRRAMLSRRGRAKPLPREWTMSDAERAAAQEIAAWGPERAATEFAKFTTWHRDRATRSVSWPASWRTWCQNGAEIDRRNQARRASNHPSSRAARAAHGAAAWYDRQKAARRGEP